jgi:iron complex transport system substrate-binding protein
MTGPHGRFWGWLRLALIVANLGTWSGCGFSARPTPRRTSPARIASLTLATDEMLAELVPAERLVAVTFLADDPEISNVAGHYPDRIVRFRQMNLEQIVALAPDLVCVAPYNTADPLKLLERSGLSLYRNDAFQSIDEIEASVTRLGARVGEPQRARTLVESMRTRRRRLAKQLHDLPSRPRVLYWAAGYTAGLGTTIDDMIREGGGVNVAAELGLEGSPEIASERVVAADPDVVLLARWKAEDRQGRITSHPILRQLRAVREGHVITIEGRYLTSVSSHAIAGAEHLARALHPGRFDLEDRP